MKKINELSIGFFGTPLFALSFLEFLFQNKINICFVVSQPPKCSGRGKKINQSPVHKWAEKNNIKTFTPKDASNEEFLRKIKSENVDFNIIVAYGKILKKEIIEMPKFLSINVHASLLPRWRGAAPIHRAILSNDKETGVSIMKVDEKLDSGPVILSKKFDINKDDNFEGISNKIINHGKNLLKQAILKIANKDIKFEYQDDKFATYAKKIEKNEQKIIWNNKASDINLQIRAFSPSPGAWTNIKNSNERIKILRAEVITNNEGPKDDRFNVGEITESFKVKCGKDFLKIELLQKEGKKPINAKDFLNGNSIKDLSFC